MLPPLCTPLPCLPRRYLSRPYGRVDRPKLKRRLLERSIASGVRFYKGKASWWWVGQLCSCSWRLTRLVLLMMMMTVLRCGRPVLLLWPQLLLPAPGHAVLPVAHTHAPLLPSPPQAKEVTHGDGRSAVQLEGGQAVVGSMVVDATGHSRRLVEFDQPFNPGGCLVMARGRGCGG